MKKITKYDDSKIMTEFFRNDQTNKSNKRNTDLKGSS